MMKIVGLIPSIIKRRNSNYLMIDYKLISFISKCFPRHQIKILTRAEKIRLDYIISIGSNSLLTVKNTKSNKIRKIFDDYYFRYSLKKNIPFLEICYGAQFIAKFFKSKSIDTFCNLKPEKFDINNSNFWEINPEENDLLIFPSHLEHSISFNNSEETRYSIAFCVNTIGKFNVGEDSELDIK